MFRFRAAFAASLVLAAGVPAPAGAAPGPAVLYAPPVDAPQLQNTGVWHAPPILVSGATAYRAGEFVYQDYLYDDLGAGNAARYPADPRYAGNAADLVELRLKPLPGELAVRLTYNSMLDPALVGTTIALGDSPSAVDMPHGANARMPAEVFVTVHGTQADAVDAATGAAVPGDVGVAVDVPRRQVDVRIPEPVFHASGRRTIRVAAASGIWDPAANAFVPQAGAAFFNVAFRPSEPVSPWRSDAQALGLAAGDLSAFHAVVDMGKLAAGVDDDSGVPTSGFMDRVLASAVEDRQGRGDPVSRKPGCEAGCTLQYAGRLQPYAVYVPPGPSPPGGFGLTLDLHGCGQTYNIGLGTRRQRQLGERGSGSIVLTPEARGDCYWYFGQAGADVFEAWADVARHYSLDRSRTNIVGTSMGGYGAFKLAAAYPDLFARAGGVVPCPGAGIEWSGVRTVPGGRARSLAPLLPSLRHVPVMSWQTTGDTTCRYDAQIALLARLDLLGYRYSALTFDGIDHTGLATAALSDAAPLAEFLGAARAQRDPARVTYVVDPRISEPAHGLEADHAYWLSGIVPANPRRRGRVDVVSERLGRGDAAPPATIRAAGALANGLPFVEVTHLGGGEDRRPGPARLRVSTRGVRSVTVDVHRARTGCAPAIDTASYEPLEIRLAGCNVTYTVERVCHPRPVFTVAVRAPAGEEVRSARLLLAGIPLPVRRRAARLDLRPYPDAVVRTRVVSVDAHGRKRIRATSHRWCPVG